VKFIQHQAGLAMTGKENTLSLFTMMTILTDPQIEQFLVDYPSWQLDGTMLVASFEFDGFLEAIEFVTDLAQIAEELWHHPDILIQYNMVTLSTTTHDEDDQITSRDIALIKAVEELLEG
jgi:4a-hydroxytetrahydrobiopterin dehydratase